ncbi:MAG: hypothetical protein ACODAJ_04450, partial [Planctomycetota bacterium]
MTGQTDSKTGWEADATRSLGTAIAAFWLLNVPLGTWLGRGYGRGADLTAAGPAGRVMSVWLLGLAVAVV